MTGRVICLTCAGEGEKSTVTEGLSMSTAMYFAPFFDEDGKRHVHDGNTRRTDYSCSRDHRWTSVSHGSCWCGWPTQHKSVAQSDKHGTDGEKT